MTIDKHKIKSNPKFWQQAAERIILFSQANNIDLGNLIIIVPTANHIKILEYELANYQNQSDNNNLEIKYIPDIKTLNHIIKEYNFNYRAYNDYKECINLYQFFKNNDNLWDITNTRSIAQKWQFIKTTVKTCHELSEKYLYQADLDVEIDSLNLDIIQANLEQQIQTEYINLSKKIADIESKILLDIWKHTISINYAPFYSWEESRNFAEYTLQNSDKNIVYISFDEEDYNLHHILDVFSKLEQTERILVIQTDFNSHALENLFPETSQNKYKNYEFSNTALNLNNLSIIECDNLEQIAEYILFSVNYAFKQGKKNLALIAQDRAAMRRIKSLMQAYSIPMADETGWKMSTSMLASFISKWINILQNKKIDLNWIKELNIFDENLTASLDKLNLHNKDLYYFKNILTKKFNNTDINSSEINIKIFFHHIELWEQGKKQGYKLEKWLDIFYDWCKWLKLDIFEHNLDSFLDYLNELTQADYDNYYSLDEWIVFLQDVLEQAHIAGLYDKAEQKVHIIALNGARLRNFEAVWFIGCDDNQLPSSQEHNSFLNENIRHSLGLETKSKRFSKQALDLLQLIYMHSDLENKNSNNNLDINLRAANIEFIYQSYDNQDNKQSLSRWLEKLCCFNHVKKIHNYDAIKLINDNSSISLFKKDDINAEINHNQFNLYNFYDSFPKLGNLKISHLNTYDIMSIYQCPYKFYLSKVAKLNQPYVIDESNFSDYGTWVHEILYQAHHKFNLNNKIPFNHYLNEASQNIFSQQKLDAKAYEMKQQWLLQLDKYNLWQSNNVNNNYQWLAGELNLSCNINLQNHNININAKLDRIDINHHHKSIKIIDYKWKSNMVKNDEIYNIQLLVYNYLYAQNIISKHKDYSIYASFLLLKDKDIKEIEPFNTEELQQKSIELMHDFTCKMTEYHNQQPFIAVPSTKCSFCEYRYMCVYKDIKDIDDE